MDPQASHSLTRTKRVWDDSFESKTESSSDQLNSVKAKRTKDDILSLLDDSDVLPDRDSIHDLYLDSVICSFEKEISGGVSLEEFGQLLDDVTELPNGGTELDRFGEFWEFQDEFPSYDSFGFELINNNNNKQVGNSSNINDEYV